MRGKDEIDYRRDRSYRITPAYAGKSDQCQQKENDCQDHPRLCGEKFAIPGTYDDENRITPAYAGKSWI